MRLAFSRALVTHASRKDFVFLTGDLGFKALEELREAMGEQFINAGVAEQNMVSVAAALARKGLRAWTYSIAPFMYARPFEQIRNDVCLHDLPVILVGNGGGYGYGVMGATHHAIEDYGSLLALPRMRVVIPAFDSDVDPIIRECFATAHPTYLRLGLSEEPKDYVPPPYQPWRKLLDGAGPTIVVVGPLVGGVFGALRALTPAPSLWVVGELPITELPLEFMEDIERSGRLIVVEEHVAAGSAGQQLAYRLIQMGRAPRRFQHRMALGYVSGLYGGQKFHRAESGLDPGAIVALVQAEGI
jgi:transketolase